ncbi:MAG TPA: mandelate racemase, partial [Candidatus Latescibacteria bacterium]|nr:mandelate racemase [Candidatus Latescibacterota bacterium]
DAQEALSLGFSAIKDHFSETAEVNIDWCTAVRETVGDEVDLLHDAVGSDYTFEEALRVGRAMGDLGVSWLEEPLPDRSQQELQRLCN